VGGHGGLHHFMGKEFRLYLATVNDEGMCVHAKAVAEGMLGLVNVRVSAQIMAAEDFGFYAEKINAAFSTVLQCWRPQRPGGGNTCSWWDKICVRPFFT
jgi:IAA-amino acid hydrolase